MSTIAVTRTPQNDAGPSTTPSIVAVAFKTL
jgi:hypothetical protein